MTYPLNFRSKQQWGARCKRLHDERSREQSPNKAPRGITWPKVPLLATNGTTQDWGRDASSHPLVRTYFLTTATNEAELRIREKVRFAP